MLLLLVLYSLVQLLINTLQGKLFKIYSSHKLLRIGVEAHVGQQMGGLTFLYVLVPVVLARLASARTRRARATASPSSAQVRAGDSHRTHALLAYTRMEGARCAEHCGVQAG